METTKKAAEETVVAPIADPVANPVADPVRYSKDQILASKRYSAQSDIINVVLDNYGRYTIDDIEKAIVIFLEGKVR